MGTSTISQGTVSKNDALLTLSSHMSIRQSSIFSSIGIPACCSSSETDGSDVN